MGKHIVSYLSSHAEIENVVLFLGEKSSNTLIYDILSSCRLKKLKIAVSSKGQRKKTESFLDETLCNWNEKSPLPQIRLCFEEEAYADSDETETWTFVFDAAEQKSKVMRALESKPQNLLIVCEKNAIDVFEVWEKFRKVTQHINILTWAINHHEEVLDWEKDINTDIELSVVFPMYKIEKYLRACIDSVIAWKADYIEFLFVDDGSPDKCAEIVREIAQKDPRVHLLQKENGGCASARQFGLERANGRYVGFVDPDDYIDESMFRKLLSRALIGSYDISYCGYKELYEETGEIREIEDVLGWPYVEGTSDPAAINELIMYRRVAIWRGIYKREMLNDYSIGFHVDIRRFDDLPFKVETFARARSVVAVPEYLYYYRMSRPGQDVSADDERLYVHFPIFKYIDQFISSSNDVRQADCVQLVKVQTHRWALEKIKPRYIKEYCRQAKTDLLSVFSYTDGCYLIKKYGSKRDLLYYISICKGYTALIGLLNNFTGRDNRNSKRIRKLKELDRAYH